MPLTTTQAVSELFSNNYNIWLHLNPAANSSNAPHGCSEITLTTANYLRSQWNPKSSPNSWNQSMSTGFVGRNGVYRWVTRSVSGGKQVIDFHAHWQGYKFLRHFKIS